MFTRLFQFSLVKKLTRNVRATQYIDGGTRTRMKSGTLRCSFCCRQVEQIAKPEEAFCQTLIESEPGFQFVAFACEMSELPENSLTGGREWVKKMSPAAMNYLRKLNKLHEVKPFVAIKVAAIVSLVAPFQGELSNEAKRIVGEWLKQEDTSRRDRIELGLFIKNAWPNKFQAPHELRAALLEIIAKESAVDPQYVLGKIHLSWPVSGEMPGYLLSIFDGATNFLTLGRNLIEIAPDRAKSMFRTFSFSARNDIGDFQVSEADLRKVLDELFELETKVPSSDATFAGYVYDHLVVWAYPDSVWYSQALERLYVASNGISDRVLAARFYRTIVMNTAENMQLFQDSLYSFKECINSYRDLDTPDTSSIKTLTTLLLQTPQIVHGEIGVRSRNVSLPLVPNHPVAEIAMDAYWRLVDWLEEIRSPIVLDVLVSGVEEVDSDRAAKRMASDFKSMVTLDIDAATDALIRLSHNSWYSDISKSRKSRCLALFELLHPILEAQAADAGATAKLGLRRSIR